MNLDSFVFLDLLGAGGQGEVHKVLNRINDKTYALKIVDTSDMSDDEIQKVLIECSSLQRFDHPNVIKCYETYFDIDGEKVYSLLELVDGFDLAEWIEQAGTFDFRRASAVVLQVALALKQLHNLGIIHRDIKAENIILDRNGNVKLIDFALIFDVYNPPEEISMAGTPDYLDPAYIMDMDALSFETDVYALGVLFYLLIKGSFPIKGRNRTELFVNHVTHEPPSILGIPVKLQRLIDQMLAKDPLDRPDIKRIIDDLKSILG